MSSQPLSRLLTAGLLVAAVGAVCGCVSQQASFSEPPPATQAEATLQEAEPTAPALSLFGDDAWLPTDELMADPIPRTDDPNSVDVFRVTFAQDGADFDPTIARDGSFMVFASTQHHYNADIFSKPLGSTVLTQLTSDTARDVQPSISPNGEWIAFTSDRDGDWSVYVVPSTGGRAVQITTDTAPEIHPSWSPDGSRLVYSKLGHSSGKWELWVSEIANTSTPHFIGYGLFPEWCPVGGTGNTGGDMILYQRSAERGDRAFGVWVMEFANGKISSPSRLIGNPSTAYINPTWSPDGRHVVFASVDDPGSVRTVSGTEARESDLWMMNLDGSTLVSLTTGTSTDLLPTWGPDGNIYFVSTRTGRDNIWSMNAREAMLAAGVAPQNSVASAPASPSSEASTPIATAPTED